MASVFVSRARDSFADTLQRLGVDQGAEAEGAERLGRRAALLVGAEHAWDHHVGPLIAADQVAELLGVGSRQAVHDRARRGGLLALRRGSRQVRFPAFQFLEQPGSTTRTVLPGLGQVLAVFADAGIDTWTVASWLCTPSPLLGARTPALWLAADGNTERAVEAARRSAARLGQ